MSDASNPGSDQAIRDIVAQLQGIPPAAPVAATPPQGIMPAPQVTPTMTYAAPQAAPAVAPRAAPDEWAPPAPVMTPPPVSPLGQMAGVTAPRRSDYGVGSDGAAQVAMEWPGFPRPVSMASIPIVLSVEPPCTIKTICQRFKSTISAPSQTRAVLCD